MAIAIPTSEAIDIENYDGLIAFVTEHLEMDAETAAQVPTFIRMAEYRLNRMVLAPERETEAILTTTADVKFVALPTGFRQLRTVFLNDNYPLAPVTLNAVYSEFSSASGLPQAFAISNGSLYFGPTPDSAYSVTLTYTAKIPQLSSANQTNWLLTDHADAYVYATLIQAESFLGHDGRIPLLNEALEVTMEEINEQGNRYRFSTPMRLRSPVVV